MTRVVATIVLAAAGWCSGAPTATATPAAAMLPPMGWNSWNSGIPLNEKTVQQTIDAMVSSGLRNAGYRYVNLDAGWAAPVRDAHGNLQADPTTFPHGIAALAQYAHRHGILLGLYSSPYNQICGQSAENASLGHERADARTFALWGVDYLKYDWCAIDSDHAAQVRVFTAMRDALRATGRRIVYSINPNSSGDIHAGTQYDWTGIADLVRTTGDLIPLWHNPLPEQVISEVDTRSMLGVVDELAVDYSAHQRRGYIADPDMLVVGVQLAQFLGAHLGLAPSMLLKDTLTHDQISALTAGLELPQSVADQLGHPEVSLTPTEQRTHFALWAMLAAPLIAGNDVRHMTPQTRDILANRDVIAIDQDPLLARARAIGDGSVLVKPLSDGSAAVALYNAADSPAVLHASTAVLGLPSAVVVRNLWSHTTTTTTGAISADVPAHGVALFRVSAR
jgi:alpha-galactosidase